MVERKRRQVKTDHEEVMLVGFITHLEFCKQIFPITKREYFQSKYAQRVFGWLAHEWETTGQPLGRAIQQVYADQKDKLPMEEAKLIETLLHHLSEKYSEMGNWPYHIDRATKWIKQRSVENLIATAEQNIRRGEVHQAVMDIQGFRVMSGITAFDWIHPFTDKELQERIAGGLQDIQGIFKFDGALGHVLGAWDRGWLVAFFGPMKRGKTWWLTETAVQAVSQGLRVAFFSLEMLKETMAKRFIINATGLAEREGEYRIPVWDCAHNQDSTCEMEENKNRHEVPRNEDDKIEFDPDSPYDPCDHCRRNPNFVGKENKRYIQNYKAATWFRMVDKNETLTSGIIKKTKAFAKHYHGGNLALTCFPRFGAGIDDMLNVLDDMEAEDGFVPDMIIVDYPDIMLGAEDREGIDKTWKRLAGTGQERKAIMVVVSQTTRKSIERRSVKIIDSAEDIRKMAHVDAAYGLNQEESERDDQVMRVGVLAHRHKEHPGEEVICLQNLTLGQPAMDTFTVSNAMAEHIAGSDDE